MSSFKYNRTLCVTDLIWIHLFISNPKNPKVESFLTMQSRDAVKLTGGKSQLSESGEGVVCVWQESPHFPCGLGQPFPICF